MKRTSLLFLLSCCTLFLQAQSYFAPIGTKWYNSRYQYGPTPPSPDYSVFTVVDTVIIQGKKCVEIQGGADCLTIDGSLYVYQENARVYFTDGPTHPFFPLYDFGAGVGQKFTTFTPSFQQSAVFLVTAVDTVIVGNQSFKVQHIELDSGYVFFGDQVIEYAGGNTLFPQSGACDPELGGLGCFNNGSFGYPSFPCGIVGTTEQRPAARVQIIPNPADEYFDLQISDWPASGLNAQIFNLSGKMIYQKTLYSNAVSSWTFDTHDWPAGLYFLKIGSEFSRKIVIQH